VFFWPFLSLLSDPRATRATLRFLADSGRFDSLYWSIYLSGKGWKRMTGIVWCGSGVNQGKGEGRAEKSLK
jgi:hypothetical protein